eukprot:COSAG02_NODE_8258_length_2639_cov_1.270866_2_plen_209_part_00
MRPSAGHRRAVASGMPGAMRRRRKAINDDQSVVRDDRGDSGGFDLCKLSRHEGVWERVVAHLAAPVARALGATCKTMYDSILYLPWSRYVDDQGRQAVYAPILCHADQNAYADHCHWLLLQLHKLFDTRGRLRKKNLGYTVECRDMRRQQSVVADDRMVAVHQTMHFYNEAQIYRKVRNLIWWRWRFYAASRVHFGSSSGLGARRWRS